MSPRERFGIIAMMMSAGMTDCLKTTRMERRMKIFPPVAMPKNRNTTSGKASVLKTRIRISLVLDDISDTPTIN